MARIAKFYEKLPKGAAPDRATGGLIGRYQARYMGKNASAARKWPIQLSRMINERKSVASKRYDLGTGRLTFGHSGLAFDLQFDGSWIRFRILLPPEYVLRLYICFKLTFDRTPQEQRSLSGKSKSATIASCSTLYIQDHRIKPVRDQIHFFCS